MDFLVFYKNFSESDEPIEMDLFFSCSKDTIKEEFEFFACSQGYNFEFVSSFTLNELLELLLNDDLYESLLSGRFSP